jgi:hypothetical protein
MLLMGKCPPSGCLLVSAGLHREHSFAVAAHRHQIPFASHILAAQQALTIDDSEHGLWSLFAQRVEFSSLRRLQPMRHLLHRCRQLGWSFWRGGKALLPADVMAAASHGNQRFDLGPRAVIDVDLTEISAISEDALGSTELFGKRLDLLDHWHQLLIVVGRLRDLGGDDQHAAGGHDRLRVVAPVKAAASDLHDARVFIRQIDLILRAHTARWWLRRSTGRLLARAFLLLGARSHFSLVFGLLAL